MGSGLIPVEFQKYEYLKLTFTVLFALSAYLVFPFLLFRVIASCLEPRFASFPLLDDCSKVFIWRAQRYPNMYDLSIFFNHLHCSYLESFSSWASCTQACRKPKMIVAITSSSMY